MSLVKSYFGSQFRVDETAIFHYETGLQGVMNGANFPIPRTFYFIQLQRMFSIELIKFEGPDECT